MNKEEIKTILDEKIKKYYEKIRFIDTVYEIYYSMKFGDERWNNLYAKSPAYFTVVRKSLGYYFIIGLCNFFEPYNSSDLNINRFIEEVKKTYKQYHSNVPEEIAEFEKFMNENRGVIKKLKVHRDKNIAHFDMEYFLDEVSLSNDAPLHPEEIQDMIKGTLHFIGKLNYIVSNEITFAEFINKDDYKKLFALYQDAINKK